MTTSMGASNGISADHRIIKPLIQSRDGFKPDGLISMWGKIGGGVRLKCVIRGCALRIDFTLAIPVLSLYASCPHRGEQILSATCSHHQLWNFN